MSKVKAGLLALLVASAFGTAAYAADPGATKFKNVTVTGTLTTANQSNSGTSTAFTGPILPYPRTLAQINALTSGTTNQLVVCTDCVMSPVCRSSGTVTPGAWTVIQGTAAAVAPLHCQ